VCDGPFMSRLAAYGVSQSLSGVAGLVLCMQETGGGDAVVGGGGRVV
jgi:hypothetical protein